MTVIAEDIVLHVAVCCVVDRSGYSETQSTRLVLQPGMWHPCRTLLMFGFRNHNRCHKNRRILILLLGEVLERKIHQSQQNVKLLQPRQ